jgi:hypothetical protein
MAIVRKMVFGLLAACIWSAAAVGAESDQVQIGHGQLDGIQWSVALRPVLKSDSSQSACLDIALFSRHLGSETTECSAVEAQLPLFDRVAIGKGKRRVTVFAVVMPPAVKRVALGLAARGNQKMRVRHLSAADAEAIGVEPFAYLIRSFTGPVCIKTLRAYDAGGATITELPFFRCHES